MKSSFRYLVAMVLIIIIAGIDYQLFSEGMGKIVRPEARQLGHLLLLLPIAITGSIAWKKHPITLLRRIWNKLYLSVLALLIVVGWMQQTWHLFPDIVLDQVRLVRLFCCSPLPFLLLAFMAWLERRGYLRA